MIHIFMKFGFYILRVNLKIVDIYSSIRYMAEQDWKTATTLFIMTLIVLNFFVLAQKEHQAFQLSSTHIKYHSNWTDSDAELHHLEQLQDAYKIQSIKSLDLSLSMSSLSFSKIKSLLPVRFNAYETLKINFANNPIGSQGADYILSLIPNGVINLQLFFDSIDADQSLGDILAQRLNNLNSVKHLKLSLILAVKNDTTLDNYLRFSRLAKNLESYSLVLIGNGLKKESIGHLEAHLSRVNLKALDLNFYSNKLGTEGAEIVAKSILSQKQLKDLSLDFYFNNITQNGTQALCNSILQINNPELSGLHYNLDFNYIKNEGAKAVGNLLSKMTSLKKLHLGVASKNFGYLGFKYLVNGLTKLTELEDFSFKCGVNRVGAGGAQITRDLLYKLKNLKKLSLNFYQNYVGDQGVIELTKAVASLQHLNTVYLNFGFNDAKGYGLVKSLQLLAKHSYNQLFLSFSSNEFQDSEMNLIKDDLREIIRNTKHFQLQFMETAISKRKASELSKLFQNAAKSTGNDASINVNSVITEEQQSTYNATAKDREEKLQKLIEADKQGKVKQVVSAPVDQTPQQLTQDTPQNVIPRDQKKEQIEL